MPLILSIDSAFEESFVALCNNEEVIAHEKSIIQKDHASFLQPAIKKMCREASIGLNAIDAIAVVNGPGSYTGLRVGLSSAKGICYVLNKPLILLNTLDILAVAMQQDAAARRQNRQQNILFCPMIDARRMEVFTALYSGKLNRLNDYASVVLDDTFLSTEKKTHTIIAGGNGSMKLKNISGFEDVVYGALNYSLNHVSNKALEAYKSQNFADLAYSEPFYIKPAYVK